VTILKVARKSEKSSPNQSPSPDQKVLFRVPANYKNTGVSNVIKVTKIHASRKSTDSNATAHDQQPTTQSQFSLLNQNTKQSVLATDFIKQMIKKPQI